MCYSVQGISKHNFSINKLSAGVQYKISSRIPIDMAAYPVVRTLYEVLSTLTPMD